MLLPALLPERFGLVEARMRLARSIEQLRDLRLLIAHDEARGKRAVTVLLLTRPGRARIFVHNALRVMMSLNPPRQFCNCLSAERNFSHRFADFLPRYTLAKNSAAYRVFLI